VKISRDPLTWILIVVGIVNAVGIGWGLPASDGWDNDGVAPRDFLPGLAATFTPGSYYTYPPVHLAILSVLTLPITLVAVVRAHSFGLHDLIAEMIKVPYMTAITYVARAMSLGMSIAIVYFLARIAEEIRGERRAAWCTAAFAGVNAALCYYGHTTNLDVPYMFWATWSLLFFTRAIVRDEARLLRRALILAVLAVGTKDQAYAVFVLSLPAALLVAWRKDLLREAAIAVAIAIPLFLFVDAAIVNPSGFAARVRFLTGSASQDYMHYRRDWSGRLSVLADIARYFPLSQYPPLLLPAIAIGGVHTIVTAGRKKLAAALLPLFVALSFTAAFNWMSMRVDARFMLPQALALSIYGGRALELVFFHRRRELRILALALAIPLYRCISLDVTLLRDPRYDAEAWLRTHVAPGETIETYGLNVYLPRMPSQARVIRVGPEPIDKRNPMPDWKEIQAPFDRAPERGARWIVLSSDWVWRYLPIAAPVRFGEQTPPTWRRSAADEAATQWFRDLVASRGAFGIVHESKYDLEKIFPPVDIHGTTVPQIWIYERKP
jgi:hypothetical protein